jgi:glutathione S-transferase
MGDKVTIYGFGAVDELLDMSPFVHKIEVYLRLAGLSYDKVSGNARRSPNGKLPCMRHNGNVVADSQAIVGYLRDTKLADLDAWLDPRQRALASTLRVALEEDLYFTLVYYRWQVGWSAYRPVLSKVIRDAGVPGLLAGIIAGWVQRGVVRKLDEQGTGRRSPDALELRAAEQLENLETLCDENGPWLLGERPCTLDAVAHAMLAGSRWPRVPTVLAGRLAAQPRLVRWLDHVDASLAS